jgi:hypothetical protein
MVTGAVAEMLLGLRRDPVYGVTLTLGMGGVTAEVLADTVTLVLPATEAQVLEAAQAPAALAAARRLSWAPKADMAAVAAMAVRLGALMLADESLEEIEINPVLVRAGGRGGGCPDQESVMADGNADRRPDQDPPRRRDP